MSSDELLLPDDLALLAKLQVSVLPGSLILRLGRRYAEAFYRYVANSPNELVFAERNGDGNVIAGAVVSLDIGTLERRLLLKTPLVFAAARRLFHFVDFIGAKGQPSIVDGPELILLFTDPAHRGKGAATRLLGRLEGRLKQHNVTAYFVRTFDNPSDPALRFYRSNGFEMICQFEARAVRFQLIRKRLVPS